MTAPLIDCATLDELQAEAGREFVAELVDTFCEEAPQMIAELRRSASGADAGAFRRAAHSIKSNGRTFGAARLAASALALEVGGLPGDAAAIDALNEELAQTVAALRELVRE